MTAIIIKPWDATNIVEPLKSVMLILLLTSFSILFSDNTLAESKPAIEVRFEIGEGPFLFNKLNDNKEQEIISIVCEKSKEKWGFLDWCPSLGHNASEGGEGSSQTVDDAPQSLGDASQPSDVTPQAVSDVLQTSDNAPSVSAEASGKIKPVWIIKLEMDPLDSNPNLGPIVLKHLLEINNNQFDLGEQVELYEPAGPIPSRKPDEMAGKIISNLRDLFTEAGREWSTATKVLKMNIPITYGVDFHDYSGEKFVTIPYKLCDLKLIDEARFFVRLIGTKFPKDSFTIRYVDVSENDEQIDFLYGDLEDWKVRQPRLNPKPEGSIPINDDGTPTEDGKIIIKLLTDFKKKVYMHPEEPLGTGGDCQMENGVVTTGPELNVSDSEESLP